MRFFSRGLLRPQYWIGLIALGVLVFGVLTTVRPAQKSVPVRKHFAVRPASHVAKSPDCTREACLALTFDDGPNPVTTPQILAALEQDHIPATFFVVGSRVPGNEALLRQMHADGDEIGNHSWTHPDFTTLKPAQIRQQINLTQQAIERSGVPAPTLFRPPYGDVNPTVAASVPLTIMFWNEDPRDWAANKPTQVAATVEASVRPGGVVDMHDIYHVTASALPAILQNLRQRHFHFVTVSQLLQLKPGQKGEFYGRP